MTAAPERRWLVISTLGATQTLAWGSTYYLPAVFADPVCEALGLSRTWFFGVLFSAALLLSGLLGPAAGRMIDQRGGRDILAAINLVFAAGLILLGASSGIVSLALAWMLIGVGMGFGLYEAAFATVSGLYGRTARGAITGTQVAARVIEFSVLRTASPMICARLATGLQPVGAAILGLVGPAAAVPFVLLHGAGNGLLTIARGTLPLALFGPAGYGLRTGILAAPARILQGAAPLVFALVLDHGGAYMALLLTGMLTGASLLALMLLSQGRATT